uniref:Uncharacterized protein n=1 Tax=Panagrolaimus sp. JU765 TaxID=591449 RepID=A0AC34RJR0_9BILA
MEAVEEALNAYNRTFFVKNVMDQHSIPYDAPPPAPVSVNASVDPIEEEAVPFEQEVEPIFAPNSPLLPFMPDFDALFDDDHLGEDVVSESDATAEEPAEPPRQQMHNRSIPRVQAVPNREDLIRQIEALKQDHETINGSQFNGNIFQYDGDRIDEWIGHFTEFVGKMKIYKRHFGN